MKKVIGNSWDNILSQEFEKDYFKLLEKRIDDEYKKYICYPKEEDIFNAFKFTPYENVKVVILGQDPYINENQAMGLSFSVRKGVPLPPSLKNIYKELSDDIGPLTPKSGDLTLLTKEGVFLLNATMSVRSGVSLSHKGLGWETFTNNVISMLNEKKTPVVFILWGRNAIEKEKLITSKIHLVINSAHPSPLSAFNGFFGSRPFSKANHFLMKNGIEPINWSILEKN